MGETAEERARRLSQIGGGESMYRVSNFIMDFDYASLYPAINPCAQNINSISMEITIASSQRCTLGDNPLVKFTKFKFNF